jgi:transcriptional regulator with XRE-family HTH domain
MARANIRLLVGKNVRRLRTAAGLTQEALAEKTGLSSVYISEIERGRGNPSVLVMADIAHGLDADVRELLDPTPPTAAKRS